jgi:pimeloyl-ACP methyl ester carboxylesterase
MPEVSNDGVRISYDVAGEGRPLVLLHGWSCDRSWWTEPGYVDDLERDHLLLLVDLRGHGASDKPHEPAASARTRSRAMSWPSRMRRASTGSPSGVSPTVAGSRG